MTQVVNVIFSEPNVDDVYENSLPIDSDEQVFAIEYLPGQYDQHGDFAAQCTQIIAGYKPLIKVAQCVVLRCHVAVSSSFAVISARMILTE